MRVELEFDAQNIAFFGWRCDGYADMSVFQKNFDATEKELWSLADTIDEIRILYVERPLVLDEFGGDSGSHRPRKTERIPVLPVPPS